FPLVLGGALLVAVGAIDAGVRAADAAALPMLGSALAVLLHRLRRTRARRTPLRLEPLRLGPGLRDLLLAARLHAARGDRDPRPPRLPAGLLGTAHLALPPAGAPRPQPPGAAATTR